MLAEVNGAPATPEQLAVAAVSGYGHFTTMRVRDGHVRGLGPHLDRLAAGTRLLFGGELDPGRVRGFLRHAVPAEGTVRARVTVCSLGVPRGDAHRPVDPDVLVTVTPSGEADGSPVRLRSVRYQRHLPEVKHVGTFPLLHHARAARLAGFDDALFVTDEGLVSEASVWNIGFVDGGGTLVWPEAPMLDGVTQRLLRDGLARLGVPAASRPVPLAEVRALRSAFLCNAGDPARPVSAVDDAELTVDPELTALLRRACALSPWEPI
ncbi:branched-subunit amino acid aminotransferase/4-amino-4-deoxychorismate lyase [Prauserella shujinwangii]|uniref:Branched-subunit amino acid aminotransferase/4-amino-4-deoxychorismate lyase n=1 Tax=Prauserella shujinwangii TaxID=1453103 RepID=A0A2T0LRR0_9PSEU|nr:aminotransferase class IV [Prauserella shujinwangii]PRX46143.1 branched-subunit amino acid aminotransferase/4-amino-4-deoxychorismate lyase [Prauserella shujinwangii]